MFVLSFTMNAPVGTRMKRDKEHAISMERGEKMTISDE
jgi:hypothetical protein